MAKKKKAVNPDAVYDPGNGTNVAKSGGRFVVDPPKKPRNRVAKPDASRGSKGATMLTKREVILAEIESTYDTDPTPDAASNAVLVINPQLNPQPTMVERDHVKPSLGKLTQIFAGEIVEFTCDVEIKGSGSAGTAPECGPLLRASAMSETIVGGTSVTYAPVSSSMESINKSRFRTQLIYPSETLVPTIRYRSPRGSSLTRYRPTIQFSARPTTRLMVKSNTSFESAVTEHCCSGFSTIAYRI